jgi:DNA adenine methylase
LQITETDVIYVDPPYDVEFTKYSKEDFSWQDQQRLVIWLSSFKNPIIASNQGTDRIINLYTDAGFKITKLSAPRRISCNGDRSPAVEILATKNL